MKRLLILTTVDIEKMPNNREHALVRHLVPRFQESALVFRRKNAPGSRLRFAADALLPRWRIRREEHVTWMSVHPPLNLYPGAVDSVSGITREPSPAARTSVWSRASARKLLSAIGVFKDLATIAMLTLAVLRLGRRFDVCIALGPWAGAAARLLKRIGKITTEVYEDRDYEAGFLPSGFRKRWALYLETACIRHADLAISIGPRLAALRESDSGRPVHIVPTGVEIASYAGAPRVEPRPTLVYVGNIAPWCGLERVFDAMASLRTSIPGLRCTVIGGGSAAYERDLVKQVERLGLGDHVSFYGRTRHSEIPNLLRHAGLGLATFDPIELRRYAAPLKVLEYLAAGLPTITTRNSQAGDLVSERGCGVATDFDTPSIANAIEGVLSDPARYARYSRSAVQTAKSYAWGTVLSREYQLIEESWRQCTS